MTMEVLPDKLAENVLFKICKPFFILLRIGGLYFTPTELEPNYSHCECHSSVDAAKKLSSAKSFPLTKSEKLEHAWKFYSLFAFSLVLAYFAKMVINFQAVCAGLGGHIFTQQYLATFITLLCFACWHLSLIVGQVVMLRACWRSSLLYDFFINWTECHYVCLDPGCNKFPQLFRPYRNRVLILGAFLIIINLAAIWFPLAVDNAQYATLRSVLFGGFGGLPKSLVGFCLAVAHFYGTFAEVMPIMLYLLIGLAINVDFRHLHLDLSERINKEGVLDGSLEFFRSRHNKLCVLTEHADGIFSTLILFTIGVSVVELFMLAYVAYDNSQKGSASIVTDLTIVFWFVCYIIMPGLIFSLGMKLNETVREGRENEDSTKA